MHRLRGINLGYEVPWLFCLVLATVAIIGIPISASARTFADELLHIGQTLSEPTPDSEDELLSAQDNAQVTILETTNNQPTDLALNDPDDLCVNSKNNDSSTIEEKTECINAINPGLPTDESLADSSYSSNLSSSVITDSGECGECSWSIDSSGLLHVWPSNGKSGRLANSKGLDLSTSNFPWGSACNEITAAEFDPGVQFPSDCSYMFFNCMKLVSFNAADCDVSLVTDFSNMFEYCHSLVSLNFTNWHTSSLTNLNHMFSYCSSLTSLDLSGWDTSSVTNMGGVFSFCDKLTSLDLSRWNTSSVTTMGYMFWGCRKLTSLDLSDWDTSSVTDMFYMFRECSSLVFLDITGWNTANVKNMGDMFTSCSSLISLDISSFDNSRSGIASFMFLDCSSLSRISIGTRFATSIVQFPLARNKRLQWYSHTDAAWYSREEIVNDRSGIADTYTLFEPNTDLSCASISRIIDQAHTGRAIEPTPIVELNSKILMEGVDYTLSYTNNASVGIAVITVTGKGEYTGKKSHYFQDR